MYVRVGLDEEVRMRCVSVRVRTRLESGAEIGILRDGERRGGEGLFDMFSERVRRRCCCSDSLVATIIDRAVRQRCIACSVAHDTR